MKYKLLVMLVALGLLFGSGIVWAEGKYKTIEVFMDRINFSVNGQELPMNKDSIMYNGSIYIPLRDLSDSLGAQVSWNEANRSVALDFVNDLSGSMFQASQKGLYQYITIENNKIMTRMIDHFNANRMDLMKDEIARYDSLHSIAVDLNDKEMILIFEKLKISAELIRTGWLSKKLDDYYLAWTIFSTNAGNLNTLLKAKISEIPTSTTGKP
jgi:hypothetical protein